MIRPWITDFSAFDHFSQPLGFLQLAAILEMFGLDIHYIDCLRQIRMQDSKQNAINANGTGKYASEKIEKPGCFSDIPRYFRKFGMSLNEFQSEIAALPAPELVLVTSGMTYWYPGIFQVVEEIRKLHPRTSIALGGIYASLCPDHAEKSGLFDVVYAKSELSEFLDWLAHRLQWDIPSISGKISPIPAWHLIPHSNYLVMRTTRGCLHNCSYCAASHLTPGVIRKTTDSIKNEIEFLVDRFHVSNIALYDDDLSPPEVFEKFLLSISDAFHGIRWHIPNAVSADVVTPRIARLMKQNGFIQPRLSLPHIDRRMTTHGLDMKSLKLLQQSVSNLLHAGYESTQISMYLTAGFPKQKFISLKRTGNQLLKLGIKPYLSQFSPIPGTPAGDRRLAELGYDRTYDSLLLTNKILSVYRHPGWSADEYYGLTREWKRASEVRARLR